MRSSQSPVVVYEYVFMLAQVWRCGMHVSLCMQVSACCLSVCVCVCVTKLPPYIHHCSITHLQTVTLVSSQTFRQS